jgi:hypothetical protein
MQVLLGNKQGSSWILGNSFEELRMDLYRSCRSLNQSITQPDEFYVDVSTLVIFELHLWR